MSLLFYCPLFLVQCCRPWGARLCRTCWCKECALTCPVHILGAGLMAYSPGSMPFEGINGGKAMANMREVLSAINLPNAHKYRTHDLKRGHTRDMMKKGHNLKEILVAADWRWNCYSPILHSFGACSVLPGLQPSQSIWTWMRWKMVQ